MKIMTILGTRPEIIRLSRLIPLLDEYCNHILIHTGQNYDYTLNEVFFKELGLRTPDYLLNCKSQYPFQEIGTILAECEQVIIKEKPDRLLILGDTNSALSAIVAKRHGIPVFHMEAGNRCYDDRVPEEVNRRIIDHSSDILMPYTERSRANLIREGIEHQRIYVTGNPIWEVLHYHEQQINSSNALKNLNLNSKKYFLVTLHRAENVDKEERLYQFIKALHQLYLKFHLPVLCSVHPRTRSQLVKKNQSIDYEGIIAVKPLGFFDFIYLEKNAACVLSDSGTVQEECCIFKIPNVTLRDVTERPETIEVGSNIISGCQPMQILNATNLALNMNHNWDSPKEYRRNDVSQTILKILSGVFNNRALH
ncbi:MAG TPA: UDP-N-acetylglucosamine 2-epimerase (non-hydrolyzing) [Firmicutes bacterium]|jgi:UDP-N-acetylglucosamine 2-epimerase (non-hydrolysing)|nr:UDP-N-acetylglucosamine 2-epimerase (non-hydrolyzing) [Bacillota bacterium]